MLPILPKRSSSFRSRHSRASLFCTARKKYADGFDEDQRAVLKSRTKRREFSGEVEYWRDVYKTLFPGVDDSRIPSPCKRRNPSVSKTTIRLTVFQSTKTKTSTTSLMTSPVPRLVYTTFISEPNSFRWFMIQELWTAS
jgi:hypothetical protein